METTIQKESMCILECNDPNEIKKCYHKMALQTHPDKPGGNEEKFKKVQKAYKLLTDPKAMNDEIEERLAQEEMKMDVVDETEDLKKWVDFFNKNRQCELVDEEFLFMLNNWDRNIDQEEKITICKNNLENIINRIVYLHNYNWIPTNHRKSILSNLNRGKLRCLESILESQKKTVIESLNEPFKLDLNVLAFHVLFIHDMEQNLYDSSIWIDDEKLEDWLNETVEYFI